MEKHRGNRGLDCARDKRAGVQIDMVKELRNRLRVVAIIRVDSAFIAPRNGFRQSRADRGSTSFIRPVPSQLPHPARPAPVQNEPALTSSGQVVPGNSAAEYHQNERYSDHKSPSRLTVEHLRPALAHAAISSARNSRSKARLAGVTGIRIEAAMRLGRQTAKCRTRKGISWRLRPPTVAFKPARSFLMRSSLRSLGGSDNGPKGVYGIGAFCPIGSLAHATQEPSAGCLSFGAGAQDTAARRETKRGLTKLS